MATVQHKDLTGTSLHEPKGADSASSGTVYVSDGAGSGSWNDPPMIGLSGSSADTIPKSNGAGSVSWVSNKVITDNILIRGSSITQYPTALDTPLQLVFGPAFSTTEFDISAAGAITCNVTGSYVFKFNYRFARTSSTGVAIIVLRYLVNGTMIGTPITCELTSIGTVVPYAVTVPFHITAGDVITIEILRDSTGNNDGGLAPFTATLAGWGTADSATVQIDKMRVG